MIGGGLSGMSLHATEAPRTRLTVRERVSAELWLIWIMGSVGRSVRAPALHEDAGGLAVG